MVPRQLSFPPSDIFLLRWIFAETESAEQGWLRTDSAIIKEVSWQANLLRRQSTLQKKDTGILHVYDIWGFSIVNHPFWGTPIFGNTHMFSLFFCSECGSQWFCYFIVVASKPGSLAPRSWRRRSTATRGWRYVAGFRSGRNTCVSGETLQLLPQMKF